MRKGRYLAFVRREVERLHEAGYLSLAQLHNLTRVAKELLAAIGHQMAQKARSQPGSLESIPVVEAIPLAETVAAEPVEDRPTRSTRDLVSLLLDPRTIQALLGLGGALIAGAIVLLL
ncbi:MAG: hypothetical protein RMI91_01510 [Gemmatales bacterium]|nr:hypothetical protein [Gemmatales bacterium]MDW7993303.1 hypothetical protein [Gemmatales bacterium]